MKELVRELLIKLSGIEQVYLACDESKRY